MGLIRGLYFCELTMNGVMFGFVAVTIEYNTSWLRDIYLFILQFHLSQRQNPRDGHF